MQIALTGDVMLGRLVDQYVIRNQSIGPDKIGAMCCRSCSRRIDG